jgi:ATP-dependent Zn protease
MARETSRSSDAGNGYSAASPDRAEGEEMSGTLRRLAIHEAGHAVIARVLTLACGSSTIKADHNSAGHASIHDPHGIESEWNRRGKVRDAEKASWYGRIIAFMAGAEAEIVLTGKTRGGDGEDRYQISLMAEQIGLGDWPRIEARLRTMTRMLVRRHRERIERVAEALLTKKTLSAKAIDNLAGRSVNDVKVNAPFLLAMHRQHEHS